MIDKLDVKVPYSASFQPKFRFVPGELRFAGISSTVRRSQHYQGVIDLRPFGFDAILHAYFRRQGRPNHKLELIDSGDKSLSQMARIVAGVFEVNPEDLELMRVDLAADLPEIPVAHVYQLLRVKLKRSADAIGELDFETIGGRRLEYFRYGKSPNCLRVYDKPAECKARMPQILKRVSPDAELPTFQDLFGFSPDATLTRVERQAGGGRVPNELAKFGQLKEAADFNPFANIEILRGKIPLPDPARVGDARALKIAGLQAYLDAYGVQQARAILNRNRNAKRIFDDLDSYLLQEQASTDLTVDSILHSYRSSVRAQIDGSIEKRKRFAFDSSQGSEIQACAVDHARGLSIKCPHENAGGHSGILPAPGENRCEKTPCKADP